MEQKKNNEIVPMIEEKFENYEKSKDFNAANCNVRDISYRQFVVEISELVANEYENLVKKLRSRQLETFEGRISQFSYRSTGKLFDDIEAWAAIRREMIDAINSSADILDQGHQASTVCRLFSSVVDLLYNLDSFSEHKVSNFLIEEAFGINPILGFVSQAFCSCVPHLVYLGLLSSFVEVLNSKFEMRGILNMIQKDIELFENIESWFQETSELDMELKKLFPFGIEADIVSDIENILTEYDSYTKVFSAVFFTNVKQDFYLMKDETFLCKAYLFSRSSIALEWYERALKTNHPFELEAEKLEIRADLMRLANSVPDSDTIVELCGHVVKLQNDPHLVQATINCVSIFFSCQELLIGAKHKNSAFFRELAERSRSCLNEIESIKSRMKENNA